jgi:twinkle protein
MASSLIGAHINPNAAFCAVGGSSSKRASSITSSSSAPAMRRLLRVPGGATARRLYRVGLKRNEFSFEKNNVSKVVSNAMNNNNGRGNTNNNTNEYYSADAARDNSKNTSAGHHERNNGNESANGVYQPPNVQYFGNTTKATANGSNAASRIPTAPGATSRPPGPPPQRNQQQFRQRDANGNNDNNNNNKYYYNAPPRQPPPPSPPSQQQQQQQNYVNNNNQRVENRIYRQQGQTIVNGGTSGRPPMPPTAQSAASSSSSTYNEAEEDYSAPQSTGPIALRDILLEKRIVMQSYTPGQHREMCPQCDGGSSGERSLAVRIEPGGRQAVYVCHRATCEWSGAADLDFVPGKGKSSSRNTTSTANKNNNNNNNNNNQRTLLKKPNLPKPEDLKRLGPGALDESAKPWAKMIEERGISLEVAERNSVAVQTVFSPIEGKHVDALVFPYIRDGQIVNAKYRGPNKSFWQVKGAEKVLYGLDDCIDSEEIIIVEGEFDKLAFEEAGYTNVVSVPDGAPGKVKEGDVPNPEDDKKYEYLWNCRAQLDTVKRFIIATDSDGPGKALAEELARRLGKERCFTVNWPEGCKDANETLQSGGIELIRDSISSAEGFPLRGLFKFADFSGDIEQYFNMDAGSELRGVSTGWRSVDKHYRVVPGELTVVTGVPNSGKSEWVDALMANLAVQHGWTFALCSLENKVHEHARKLVEKYVGEPWFDTTSYAKGSQRMNPQTMKRGMRWLNDHFVLIRHEDDELPSVDWILGLARAAVLRHGIRGLLIDPYNELDHKRPTGQTETEYVSQMLTRIKRFAQHYDVHVWFVAHPRQLHNWKGEMPGLYDISGSAHFINKCDNGIVIHRNRDEKMGSLREVTVNLAKVRNKVAGSIGDPKLEYNVRNGRYEDFPEDAQAPTPKNNQQY